jgi:hypothetical protein
VATAVLSLVQAKIARENTVQAKRIFFIGK